MTWQQFLILAVCFSVCWLLNLFYSRETLRKFKEGKEQHPEMVKFVETIIEGKSVHLWSGVMLYCVFTCLMVAIVMLIKT